ncbi:MAG: hypothetical protein HY986_10285 [Candidatus Melainabacteria bacterium]|nr:hypothetical protein [Candidatus Melainabacteria bacterium]
MPYVNDNGIASIDENGIQIETHEHFQRWLTARETTIERLATEHDISATLLAILTGDEQLGEYSVEHLRVFHKLGLGLADILAINE